MSRQCLFPKLKAPQPDAWIGYKPLQTCCVRAKLLYGLVSKRDTIKLGRQLADFGTLDCFYSACHSRFKDFCQNALGRQDGEAESTPPEGRLLHFATPTLAHFIALLCRPTQSSLPTDTALIVVDSLSALINHAFPRTPAPKSASRANAKGAYHF